jgi:hypothetical protein
MTSWWVIGSPDKTQFVSWSCGQIADLDEAAVYRSEANAEKKLKSLHKFCPGEYTGFMAHEIKVTV